MLDTPIAFFIFRRPDLTQQVFESIRAARPKRLFIVADGPRNVLEATLCTATRQVVDNIDWPCEVSLNYAEHNMGLRLRLVSGLSWVFDHVSEAIILEDDCLPNQDFFRFCNEMLDHFRDVPQVMHISGDNFLRNYLSISDSYYFSRYPHVWGWATWRRAWAHYDPDLIQWMRPITHASLLSRFDTSSEKRFWKAAWNGISTGEINSWAYQWAFACLLNNGLCVMPSHNLVENIGFRVDGTHTTIDDETLRIQSGSLSFPLVHSKVLTPNAEADNYTASLFFERPSFVTEKVRTLVKALRLLRRT